MRTVNGETSIWLRMILLAGLFCEVVVEDNFRAISMLYGTEQKVKVGLMKTYALDVVDSDAKCRFEE